MRSGRRRRVIASSSSRIRDPGTESRFVPRESLVYVSAEDRQLEILKYRTRVFAFKPPESLSGNMGAISHFVDFRVATRSLAAMGSDGPSDSKSVSV